jgi:hypothetical protein
MKEERLRPLSYRRGGGVVVSSNHPSRAQLRMGLILHLRRVNPGLQEGFLGPVLLNPTELPEKTLGQTTSRVVNRSTRSTGVPLEALQLTGSGGGCPVGHPSKGQPLGVRLWVTLAKLPRAVDELLLKTIHLTGLTVAV